MAGPDTERYGMDNTTKPGMRPLSSAAAAIKGHDKRNSMACSTGKYSVYGCTGRRGTDYTVGKDHQTGVSSTEYSVNMS